MTEQTSHYTRRKKSGSKEVRVWVDAENHVELRKKFRAVLKLIPHDQIANYLDAMIDLHNEAA